MMRKLPEDHGIQQQLSTMVARHLAASNILGRLDVLTKAQGKAGRRLRFATTSRHDFAERDDTIKLGFKFDLPADDPAAYIRNLTPVTRGTFDGLTAQYRKLAFTIAGTSDVRLVQRVRDELADVIQHGGSAPQFTAAIDKMTTDAGVERINAFTLDTAFNTATQRAYSLGRYEQLSDDDTVAVLPFWTYMTVGDDRVRPEHAVLDGFTARAEDPVWDKIYPPNGFNCRCIVVPKLASEVSDEASDDGRMRLPLLAKLKVPQEGFGKVF